MTPLCSRINKALGRVAPLALALLLVAAGPAAAVSSAPGQGGVDLPALLKKYPFSTVPLAASLTVKTPRVKQEAGALPLWKQNWDEARQLAGRGQLAQAAQLYQALLQEKDVPEARWEWATILVALGRDGEAIDAVEALHELTPNRPEYLHCLAVMNLHLGRFHEAAAAFAQLGALPSGNGDALAGQAYALLAAGDKQAALPLLEALSRLTPRKLELREALAALAYELHEDERAWGHLVFLASEPKPTAQVLLLAARLSDTLKRPEQGVVFWQRLVEARPDELEGRQWLADYFAQRGQMRQALPHLLALHRQRPADLLLLKRIGQAYAAVQEFAKAADFLEKYAALRFGGSAQHPQKLEGDSVQPPPAADGDKEVAALLFTVQGAMGHKVETLQALERYFALEPQPGAAELQKAARLYGELGRHAEALAAYRRLLALHPVDPELLRAAANQALAAGAKEEALSFWSRLAELSPAEISLYREMARILAELGRQPELYEALAVMHRLDPADHALSLQLVARYFAEDRLGSAAQVLATMEKQGGSQPAAFFYWRGVLRLRQHDYAAALPDLEVFLTGEPGHEAARRQVLIAAGRLGDVTRVRLHHQALNRSGMAAVAPAGRQALPPDLQLLVAQAYADCRAEEEARALYQALAEEAGAGEGLARSPLAGDAAGVAAQAFAGLAASFIREKRPYEAEEALRTGLVLTADRQFFLPCLFSLALVQGQVEEARRWLAALRSVLAAGSPRLALMESRLLIEQGESTQARRRLRALDDLLPEPGPRGGAEAQELMTDRLDLADQWFKTGKKELAAKQCLKVLAVDADSLTAKVILALSKDTAAQGLGRIDLATLPVDRLLELAGLYQRYDLPEKMGRAAQQALDLAPASLPAGLLLAESLEQQGDFGAVQGLLEKLAAANPEEFYLKVRIVTLQAKRGEQVQLDGLLAAPSAQSRPELGLLQARLLWRQNQWEEAIAVYRQLLTPSVAELLRQRGEESRTLLPEAKRDRSIWEVLTRDPGPDPDTVFAGQVMDPNLVMALLDRGERRFSLAAARLLARYRWQAQFAMELAPRLAVVRREYTIAQKQYEALLSRYPHESLVLYDLAGIYSRLGSLGQEAAAYDQLDVAGVAFPELDEAKARNRLKQQPRAALTYGYQSDAGRRGYLDMTREWQGLSSWESFSTQHEAEAKVERINYHAGSRDDDSVQSSLTADVLRANRATAAYSAALLSGLTIRGMGGVESQSSNHALLLNAGAIGKIGDGLTGTITFDRDVVRDTLASLQRHLIRQDLLGGVALDPLPRFSVGGEYLLRDYSDNNWTTGYDLWASYLLFAEPTLLRLKYLYDFKESREGGAFAGGGADGFAANDHPYWAPKNYWVNQVGLSFRHSLAADSLGRGTPHYYTIEYDLGHDSDGYAVQTAQFGLFAEFSPHCLLELASELVDSQAVRKQEYRLSATYRW